MKRLGAALAVLLLPALAGAQDLLSCAADTHVSRRGDYTNGSTANVDHDVWEWEIGSGTTYNNVEGITALGLLYAYEYTGDASHALATFTTANLLIGRYLADPAVRPYAADIELLAKACAVDPGTYAPFALTSPMGSAYCTYAQQFYGRVVGEFPDPNDNVDRHFGPRGSLSGWDVAWHIRAAWETGYHQYAVGMVDRILSQRATWEHVLLGGWDYTQTSWAALSWTIFEMHAAGDIGISELNQAVDMTNYLRSSQDANGSWQDDPQATAYALLALKNDPTHECLDRPALAAALNFMEATASAAPTCGWNYPPEYGEVNSEALMGLSRAYAMPFCDGFEPGDASAWSQSFGVTSAPLQTALLNARSIRRGSVPIATAYP